jgi:hypothetical protein
MHLSLLRIGAVGLLFQIHETTIGIYLCIYLSMYSRNYNRYLSMYQSNSVYIYLSIGFVTAHLPSDTKGIYLSIYLSRHLSIHPSIYAFMYLSIYISIHLSIYPSIYLSIYLYIYLSIGKSKLSKRNASVDTILKGMYLSI